jgi:hypothetical protein
MSSHNECREIDFTSLLKISLQEKAPAVGFTGPVFRPGVTLVGLAEDVEAALDEDGDQCADGQVRQAVLIMAL